MNTTQSGCSATRRLILKGTVTVALIGLGNIPFGFAPALAAANDKYPEDAFKQKGDADAIKSLYGKTAEPSDKVKLDAPEIAENGAVVPISVTSSLADVTSISILVANWSRTLWPRLAVLVALLAVQLITGSMFILTPRAA